MNYSIALYQFLLLKEDTSECLIEYLWKLNEVIFKTWKTCDWVNYQWMLDANTIDTGLIRKDSNNTWKYKIKHKVYSLHK